MAAIPGKLFLKVHAARDLKEISSRMQPYVSVTLGTKTWRTRARPRTNPISWEEEESFEIPVGTSTLLVATVMDAHSGKYVGKRELDFGTVLQGNRIIEGWFPLRRKSGKFAGDVKFRIWFKKDKKSGSVTSGDDVPSTARLDEAEGSRERTGTKVKFVEPESRSSSSDDSHENDNAEEVPAGTSPGTGGGTTETPRSARGADTGATAATGGLTAADAPSSVRGTTPRAIAV